MDRNQLIAFERIVREGSFSRAAREMGVSQAAISGRIQALEEELGASLFVRGGRKVTLSGAGEAFLPYARRALAVLGEGVEAARQAYTGQFGRVTIGTIESVSDSLLVPVVAAFQAAHPAVVLSVRTGHTPQIVQEVRDGIVRLGLVTWSYVTGAADLDVIARLREPLVAVAAPSHPLSRRETLRVEDVIRDAQPYHETAWGTPEDTRLASVAQRAWADHELPHGLMRQLIQRGIGAGFLPASLVIDDVRDGRLVALPVRDLSGLVRDIAFVCHTSIDELPPVARAFADALVAETARREMLQPVLSER